MAEALQNAINIASEYIWSNALDKTVNPEVCVASLPFLEYNCFTVLITKLIGIAIICFSSINKAPVFFNIINTQSGAGISMNSIYAESIMYSNAAFYGILRGNPFTSWGENGIVTLQTLGVVFILWKYKTDPAIPFSQRVVAIIVYAIYAFSVFTFLEPETYHYLHRANYAALLLSRGSQIISTFGVKHTGNQSIFTILMNMSGTVVRIFTTLKEVGMDFALLSGYFLSAGLNSVILIQYFYFRSNTVEFLKKLKKDQMKAEEKKMD